MREGNRIEMNEDNNFRIFFPFLQNFNGGNGKSSILFENLSGRELNKQERTLIPLYSLKILNFHSPQNWKELEGMKLDLMIFY